MRRLGRVHWQQEHKEHRISVHYVIFDRKLAPCWEPPGHAYHAVRY